MCLFLELEFKHHFIVFPHLFYHILGARPKESESASWDLNGQTIFENQTFKLKIIENNSKDVLSGKSKKGRFDNFM